MGAPIYLLLADDDLDDCLIFREALEELPVSVDLQVVNDGQELMQFLVKKTETLPTVLFLDINMPLKNGVECLAEIKNNENLRDLPVVIYSTSYDEKVINTLYNNGAWHYIRKPSEFSKIKEVLQKALSLISIESLGLQPVKENFILKH